MYDDAFAATGGVEPQDDHGQPIAQDNEESRQLLQAAICGDRTGWRLFCAGIGGVQVYIITARDSAAISLTEKLFRPFTLARRTDVVLLFSGIHSVAAIA